MVDALPDREIELHHEDGRIVFAFKETVLATIKDVDPEVRLVGERRTRLNSQIGKGRKGGAQPDLGLWVDAPEGEQCLMVIEVKHYRKAARRRFHEVLVDYAAAHPKAQILLVNHGPVSDMLAGVDAATAARCFQIGDLTPSNVARLEGGKERVRAIMPRVLLSSTGAPVSSPARPLSPTLCEFWLKGAKELLYLPMPRVATKLRYYAASSWPPPLHSET